MYNPANFTAAISTENLMNAVTGGSLAFSLLISNRDPQLTLYNVSLSLVLPDGTELVNSSIPYSTESGSTYDLINMKDLAPGELNYSIDFKIQLNSTYSNGDVIPFDTLLPLQLTASADTMPRGNYDAENEVIQSTAAGSINVSRYIIQKTNPAQLLLGNEYTSTITIQTSENSDVLFREITDLLGDGLKFIGDVTISGYTSQQLISYQVMEPTALRPSYQLIWNHIEIPQNTVLNITYTVMANEKYYVNGIADGAYIQNGDSAANLLSWEVDDILQTAAYEFDLYEVLLGLSLSKHMVDVNDTILYTISFRCNTYHDLLSLSGYLQTSDGQMMADHSSLMYTSKVISSGGITQLTWNVGLIPMGTTSEITVSGVIGTAYIHNGMPILTGDNFSCTASCSAISAATNRLVNYSSTAAAQISVPSVSKTITGYYYSDLTPKTTNILAPGDYVGYQMTYDSADINAASTAVKIFDFYPYVINNIMDIDYVYSSQQYPATGIVSVDPYGVLWYVNSIAGNEKFTISAKAQIDGTDAIANYLNNLFKLQVRNSEGISYARRAQIGFLMGEPNLQLTKAITGSHPNRIEIGEIYTVIAMLKNDNSEGTATDAFSFDFTENIPDGVTLDPASVTVTIDGTDIPYTIQNSFITIAVTKLTPGGSLSLRYQISINHTLGPDQVFTCKSSTTVPYTQLYVPGETNYRYQLQPVLKNISISSAPVALTVGSDAPSKRVGEHVEYTLNITFPAGQKLTSFYGLLLIPGNQIYLNDASENGEAISAVMVGRSVIFPTITGIDTTKGPISYHYRIGCTISDCSVSAQNPLNTVEYFYGNLNYVTLLNSSRNIGTNNVLRINHPYIELSIGSSAIMSAFNQIFLVGYQSTLYTNATATNLGIVDAENISLNILIPNLIAFQVVERLSDGVTYSYN